MNMNICEAIDNSIDDSDLNANLVVFEEDKNCCAQKICSLQYKYRTTHN